MPLTGSAATSAVATRLLLAAAGFVLLASASVAVTAPAAAADVSGQISANRSYIEYAQSAMLSADSAIAALQQQKTAAKREMKDARAILKQLQKWWDGTLAMVATRQERLAEVEGQYDAPSEASDPDAYKERVRELRNALDDAISQKQDLAPRLHSAQRVYQAKRARLAAVKRSLAAAASRQRGAQATLAARIVEMQRLGAIRAAGETTISLSADATFSWPTTGRITQTYGCTGYRLNPPRGSCRHFHDGIDVVDSYGTPVRAVAAGVVAYSGWNPWDEGGRAWIVVVVHPDGYVSRYGHLIAKQRVPAGGLVHTGQVIGGMGSTGKSTGTHLHFELLRDGRDVNPLSYLPSGEVRILIDRTTTRQGEAAKEQAKAEAEKKARAKARARAKRLAKKPLEAFGPTPKDRSICTPRSQDGKDKDGPEQDPDCVISFARLSGDRHAAPFTRAGGDDGEVTTEPGVPLPYRRASPDPA